MFKKIAMVTAISSAFIFGSAFDRVDAESNYSTNHKVYYSFNGESGSLLGEEAQTKFYHLLKQWTEKYNIDWQDFYNQDEQKAEPEHKEEPAEKQETTPKEEQVQEEEPAQEETHKEQPVKEPVVEAPTTNEQAQEATPEQAKESDTKETQSSELSQFEQEVVELTNEERQKNGLAPLQIDTALSKVAREKSRDMATNNYFSHNSPTYGSPFDMMNSFGITYRTAGENIAKGQRTPEEVVNAWMNSAGHRANILNENFTHIGVGYVENGNVWTQQFIGK
ncbi:CAP domain-containing protein [Salirhabdus sp. Marseille-P4669]|uniref:CAP domain-containing protein n=1 Tax=Salirhabdus sp. Marseille-P4669 TaxID=2042310 RepID=UPI000C7CA6C2|nr:CAP domain-containing protein [Salirhabdus sp. Marseille-P4669]